MSEALSAVRQLTAAIGRYHDVDDRQRVFARLASIFRRTEIVSSYESFLLILSFRDSRNAPDSEWAEFVDNVLAALPSMESVHRQVVQDDTAYGEVIKVVIFFYGDRNHVVIVSVIIVMIVFVFFKAMNDLFKTVI